MANRSIFNSKAEWGSRVVRSHINLIYYIIFSRSVILDKHGLYRIESQNIECVRPALIIWQPCLESNIRGFLNGSSLMCTQQQY
jgi:hypothetical protein